MFSQVIAVALCALVAQPAMATSCSRSYTVKSGDYCDSISAANNVSTYQLAVNNVKAINGDCSNLTPGSTLCLGRTGEDCQTTYVVKTDDTCDGIASAAGINSTILNANNPQINSGCTNIYIGEVLCTAKSVQVAPAHASASALPIPSPSSSANTASDLGNGNEDDLPFCDEL
jgi:LysM repeat protein